LERANLAGADFTGAAFVQMEQWGEPDFTGAIVSDHLRYRYGIVQSPRQRLIGLLERGLLSDQDMKSAAILLPRLEWCAASPEAMLHYDELGEGIEYTSFVRILKLLKDESHFAQ
jgi:hypothetical protein